MLSPPLLIIFVIVASWFVFNKEDPSVALLRRIEKTYNEYKEYGFKKVVEESGRFELGLQALRLTRLSSLAGWGPGGFYRNLHNIRLRNGEKSYFPFDNANNHYLQMSSELGIIGGGVNLFLHIVPLWMIFRVRNRIKDQDERLVVVIIFTTVIIMILLLFLTHPPHPQAVSVQWILVVMLSFLFITALKSGYTFKPATIKFVSLLLVLAAFFTWGTYNNAFGKEGYRARQKADWWPYKYEKNCYDYERWPKGTVRWCSDEASIQFPIVIGWELFDKTEISIVASHPDIEERPLVVRYGGKHGPLHKMVISKRWQWKTIEIPLTDEYIFEVKGQNNTVLAKYLVLSFDVSRVWVPKQWKVSNDTRRLGIAVLFPDARKLYKDLDRHRRLKKQ